MAEVVIYEKVGQIAKIWLNRPNNSNLFTKEMLDQLEQAVATARNDSDVRVVILQGKGENFCSGYEHSDPSVILAATGKVITFDERRRDTQHDIEYWMSLYDLKKPLIGGLRGDVMGSGTWIAMSCDCLIAGCDTELHNLEYALGLNYTDPFPFYHWKLPMNIAKEFAYTGYPLTAETGLRYGIFNHVVDPDKVDEACMKLAHRMLRLSPYTLTIQKELADLAYDFKGLRHILPFSKEALSAGLTITTTQESDAYWAFAREHGAAELPEHYRQLLLSLRDEEDWNI